MIQDQADAKADLNLCCYHNGIKRFFSKAVKDNAKILLAPVAMVMLQ